MIDYLQLMNPMVCASIAVKKRSLLLDVYRMPFFYGKADKPYQELANVLLCLNTAHDTIVVRRSHLVGIDRPVIIPDYLSVPYDAEVCTLRRVKEVGESSPLLDAPTRHPNCLPNEPTPFTMTKLIRLLSLILLLSGVRVSAQTQVVGLRDFKRVWDSNRNDPESYYFEDQHHDLDKFVGEWEGMGFGNHLWRVHIVVLKKANYYDLLLVRCSWTGAINHKGW